MNKPPDFMRYDYGRDQGSKQRLRVHCINLYLSHPNEPHGMVTEIIMDTSGHKFHLQHLL